MMSFFENKKRRIVIDGKIGVATIDPVNPGAKATPRLQMRKRSIVVVILYIHTSCMKQK